MLAIRKFLSRNKKIHKLKRMQECESVSDISDMSPIKKRNKLERLLRIRKKKKDDRRGLFKQADHIGRCEKEQGKSLPSYPNGFQNFGYNCTGPTLQTANSLSGPGIQAIMDMLDKMHKAQEEQNKLLEKLFEQTFRPPVQACGSLLSGEGSRSASIVSAEDATYMSTSSDDNS